MSVELTSVAVTKSGRRRPPTRRPALVQSVPDLRTRVVPERVRAFAALLPEWCVGAAIVSACVLVFANTLHNTYALDDFYRLVDNPSVQRLWPPWHHFTEPPTLSPGGNTQYRPLLPLSLSIDYAIA